MWPVVEPGRFRPRKRGALELGMVPLIDIIFLLLIFFMLTSSFITREGIQVDLPVTQSPHTLRANEVQRITVRSDGTLLFREKPTTLSGLEVWLQGLDPDLPLTSFEIQSDGRAAVQTVVYLLELLREYGASGVSLGTISVRDGNGQ